jgi:hypothetical protein
MFNEKMGHALKSVKFLHCHPIPCIPLNHPTTPHFYDTMWKNTQFLLDVRSKIFYTNYIVCPLNSCLMDTGTDLLKA